MGRLLVRVQHFYSGKDGWLTQSDAVIAKIGDATTHANLAAQLQALGLRVSAEWSKTNACRKIRTTTGLVNIGERGKPALSTWGAELRDAAQRDRGDRKSTRLNSSHLKLSRMPSSA